MAEFTNQERPANTKPFAIASDQLKGKSNVMKYQKYGDYVEAQQLHRMCLVYAQAYSETMLNRLLAEQEDFFEDKQMSREEFSTHLQNNICLPISKYHSNVFRDTTA